MNKIETNIPTGQPIQITVTLAKEPKQGSIAARNIYALGELLLLHGMVVAKDSTNTFPYALPYLVSMAAGYVFGLYRGSKQVTDTGLGGRAADFAEGGLDDKLMSTALLIAQGPLFFDYTKTLQQQSGYPTSYLLPLWSGFSLGTDLGKVVYKNLFAQEGGKEP